MSVVAAIQSAVCHARMKDRVRVVLDCIPTIRLSDTTRQQVEEDSAVRDDALDHVVSLHAKGQSLD